MLSIGNGKTELLELFEQITFSEDSNLLIAWYFWHKMAMNKSKAPKNEKATG